MIKQRRNGNIKELFGMLIAITIILISSNALAGNGPSGRDWLSSDEAIQSKKIREPSQILQVDFHYDADAAPVLKVVQAAIKQGYAPKPLPNDSGYVLLLKSIEGDILLQLFFQIPNVILGIPPRSENDPVEGPLVLRKVNFSLTVALPDNAAELVIKDPQSIILFQKNISEFPVFKNRPNFRTLPPKDPSPRSLNTPKNGKTNWLYALIMDFFIATAEAETYDGTMVDIAIIGDNYTADDLSRYNDDVNAVIGYTCNTSPFFLRLNQIAFHSVENTTVDLDCQSGDWGLVCDSNLVFTALNDAGAPYDVVLVLLNGASGGTAMWADRIAIAGNEYSLEAVSLHELAHNFRLRDEYNYSSSNGPILNETIANCWSGESPPCPDWVGIPGVEYAQGCTAPNWWRSSSCSLMKSLGCEYFNAVSERLLNSQFDFYAGPPRPWFPMYHSVPSITKPSGSSTIYWDSLFTTTCTASGAWSGTKGLSDSETVTVNSTSDYTLTCSGDNGSVESTITITVDSTAPSKPVVTDGGAYTNSTTTLNASWTGAVDSESGIAQYQYRITQDTATGTVIKAWTSTGTTPSVTATGLTLTQGKTYYFGVKAKNGVGLWSAVGYSNGIKVDTTAPSKPVVTDGGAYTNSTTTLNASWTGAVDLESGIAQYQYRITQDSTTGTVIKAWTSTGTTPSVTVTGLTLTQGKTYYFGVKAKNGAGTWSAVGYSNGIRVNTPPTAPTVTGPSSGIINTGYSFTAETSDADGDYLHLNFIFLGTDGTEHLVAIWYNNPATQDYSWDKPGNYYVKVSAEDDKVGGSSWTRKDIVIE